MAKPALSLMDYVKEKKRRDCPVCALPEEIREQLKQAGARKIKRADQLEWLAEQVKVTISNNELTAHYNAHHDS